jgi:hypothetical protein
MLHLFGKRLGQKGSTLYTGGFCACVAGATARNPKQEIAIAAAQILNRPIAIGINNSSSQYSFPNQMWANFDYERNRKMPAQKVGGSP